MLQIRQNLSLILLYLQHLIFNWMLFQEEDTKQDGRKFGDGAKHEQCIVDAMSNDRGDENLR